MANCPSESWMTHEQDQESAENASDQERLAALDAYGHLTYTVGCGNEDDDDWDTRGDMLWCFDFSIHNDIDRGIVIAYHVVVNSESGAFIDTQETGVVDCKDAPYDVPATCMNQDLEDGGAWTDEELTQAQETNTRWNAALKSTIAAAQEDA